MFFSYLVRELGRRRKQAIVVALGLALGIGLTIAVTALSSGVGDAQASVLHSLYGVGTDMTVTSTANSGGGPGPGLAVGQGGFSRDQIVAPPGEASFSSSKVEHITSLRNVSAAAGGLSLNAIHITGKIPNVSGALQPGAGASSGGGTPNATASIKVSTITIAGVDVRTSSVGVLSPSQVTTGRTFTSSDASARSVIVSKGYASEHGVSLGESVELGGKSFKVIGLATGSAGGQGSNIYMPLRQAQDLADLKGKVNTVYVKASSSTQIDSVKQEIKAAEPSLTVTTASDLASQVSGSLSSASTLLSKFSKWLSIILVSVAVLIASLLTLSSVGRRIRELGTLKAIGWRTRRVVGQIVGETLVLGVLGGLLGVLIGLGAAALAAKFTPSLTATVSAFGSGAGGPAGAGGGAGGGANPFQRTVEVALTAPVSARLVVVAIALAVLGGIVAGAAGGWRAARLRPADAMRQIA